nr:reverse transcriptase domain-containing protein [Tanacetum cinerariifolium]
MDDFSVFGNSFETCLSHLDKMLKWCKDTNLCLNWEKNHFMIKEGIVLGHKILKNEIEVDKAKVDVIAKLPHPTTVKGAVLGKRKTKYFQPMHYTRKTMTDAQAHYTTTKKELLAVMEKSRNVMKCLKMPSKFARSSMYGASISWGHSCLYEGTSKYSWQSTTCLNGLTRKRSPSTMPELFAYENTLIYKEKTKRIHDSKIKDRVLNVGDPVLLFNSRLKIFLGKLKTRWTRPFTVTQVFPYGTVELSQPSRPNFKVNGHRLKHSFERNTTDGCLRSPNLPQGQLNLGTGQAK